MSHLAPMPPVGVAMLAWALWYACVLGWPVFPCKGKKPRTKNGFKDATIDPDQIAAWWAKWPTANIGTPTGERFYVIDQDNRADGNVTLRDLEDAYSDLPPTVTCLTGRKDGSQHKYFVGPVVNKAALGAGLDVQGDGSYVILPPSIHPDTALRYEWEADFSPEDLAIAPAPDWLTALVTTPKPAMAGATDHAYDPDAVIPEGRRETTFMAIGGAMRRHGASATEIRAAFDAMNIRTAPQLEDKDLDRMTQSLLGKLPEPVMTTQNVVNGHRRVVSANTAFLGFDNTAHSANDHEASIEDTAWWNECIRPYMSKAGKIEANDTTLLALFNYHPDWQGRFWWDDMASKMMLGDNELAEDDFTKIGAELGRKYLCPIKTDRLLERCIYAVCQQAKRDPLQEWLARIPGWDGVKRLETWLLDCAGLVDTAYRRFCSKILPVSMIARACDPGCICRYVLILEGPEEYRKSTFVSSLVPRPEWCDELTGSLDNKEAHLMVQGLWVAELAELDSLPRTEGTKLKSFISMRVDSHIPKYKNIRVRPLRRTIFVGTTNDSCYLISETGNTRFFPLTITRPMDIEGFLGIREQLFAEAMLYYNDNPEQWWRMSAEAEAEAIIEREQRRQALVIEDDFHEWLTTRRFTDAATRVPPPTITPVQHETTWAEIALYYYGLHERDKWNMQLQKQAAQALKTLGWKPCVTWRENTKGDKERVRLWVFNPFSKIDV